MFTKIFTRSPSASKSRNSSAARTPRSERQTDIEEGVSPQPLRSSRSPSRRGGLNDHRFTTDDLHRRNQGQNQAAFVRRPPADYHADEGRQDSLDDGGTMTVQPPSPTALSPDNAVPDYPFPSMDEGQLERSVSESDSLSPQMSPQMSPRGFFGERVRIDSAASEASSYGDPYQIWVPEDIRGRDTSRAGAGEGHTGSTRISRSTSHEVQSRASTPSGEARSDPGRLDSPLIGESMRRARSLTPAHGNDKPIRGQFEAPGYSLDPVRAPMHLDLTRRHRCSDVGMQRAPLPHVTTSPGVSRPERWTGTRKRSMSLPQDGHTGLTHRPTFRERNRYCVIQMITDATFNKHEGFDLTASARNPLFQPKLPSFRVPEQVSWSEFKGRVAGHMHYSTEQFRLWSTERRRNGTLRLKAPVREKDSILPSDEVSRTLAIDNFGLLVYLEMLSNPLMGRQRSARALDVLVLLKHFDVSRQWLRGSGSIYAPSNATESDLRSRIIQSLGWKSDTNIRLYKEIAPGRVEQCKSNRTAEPWANGDIISFQHEISQDEASELQGRGLYPDLAIYYEFLRTRAGELLQVTQSQITPRGFSLVFPPPSEIPPSSGGHRSPAPEDLRWTVRCCVEIEYLLRSLVQQTDKTATLSWFAAYVQSNVYSARCKPFLAAIQALKDQYASRMSVLLQSILDQPDCYLSSTASDAHSFRTTLLRLLERITSKSQLDPLAILITDIDVDFTAKPVALGGSASVFLGYLENKRVALKRLHVSGKDAEGHSLRRKFYREALLWRQLKHRFVLPFLGIYSSSNTLSDSPCLVSPWMARGTLLQYAQTIDVRNGYRERMLAQTAEGIAYLHVKSIVHGDIKGTNVFVNDSGEPQLADFGLAVVSDSSVGLTATAHGSDGTVRWMAPELVDDAESQQRTFASDAYAFGCLCLEVFTLKPPFALIRNSLAVPVALSHGKRPPRPTDVECRGRAMSDGLWQLITHDCWAQRPEDRATLKVIAANLAQ